MALSTPFLCCKTILSNMFLKICDYLVSFKIVDEDIWQPEVLHKLQVHGLEYWVWISETMG